MVKVSRRVFLQGTAGALGAIGLGPGDLIRQAERYGRVLARPTRRKLALLVGINDYAREPLAGSLYDVELQRQLLIHRFGFLPQDVHVVTNGQATRQGILDAYQSYLLDSVREGDVVVFHFSGHGARVQEYQLMREFLMELGTGCIDPQVGCQNTTIVPAESGSRDQVVEDIMGHTLLLLRAALPTDNVTFVLDCCYSGGGKRGNVIMRSQDPTLLDGVPQLPRLSDAEWPYQQQLLQRLGWGPQEFARQIRSPQGHGFFVAAARAHQQSADYPFDGFAAGAFTYLLTQYLWHESSPLSVTIPVVAGNTTRLSDHSQVPEYDPQGAQAAERPIYHTAPLLQPAEALVKGLHQNGQLQLWLGGLAPSSLEAFDQEVVFTVIHRESGAVLGAVQQVNGSRDGLNALGMWQPVTAGEPPAAAVGHLLREQLRGLPDPIILRLGLDQTLTAAETAQARELLMSQAAVELVQLNAGETMDVLIGRHSEAIQARMVQSDLSPELLPAIGSVGFFSPTQEPLYVPAFGAAGESIVDAIPRLAPRLSGLLVRRILGLLVNAYSQQLGVGLLVEHRGSRSGITTRSGNAPSTLIGLQSQRGMTVVSEEQRIEVIVENSGPQNLYVGLVVIDAAGEVTVVFPYSSQDAQRDIVYSGETRSIVRLKGTKPYGLGELLLLASSQPLRDTLRALGRVSAARQHSKQAPDSTQFGPTQAAKLDVDAKLSDSLRVVDSTRGPQAPSSQPGPRTVRVDQIAVISQLYEVVPGA